jgi:hypothetical protein
MMENGFELTWVLFGFCDGMEISWIRRNKPKMN